MATKIILITGGQRSGKSSYAERLALSLSPNPVYMATARVWDEEFRQRVCRHQERRGEEWTNIEEPLHLSSYDVQGRVVLVDCVTLWCTNFFFESNGASESNNPSNDNGPSEDNDAADNIPSNNIQSFDVDTPLAAIRAEFDRLTAQAAMFIFVTNEIGMGGVSDNALQRRFTDMQGWMNQYIANRADEVTLMVSGLPVKIR